MKIAGKWLGAGLLWVGVCGAEEVSSGEDGRPGFRRLAREEVLGQAPETSESGAYTVRAGDTLAGIAGRFGMSVAELIAINKLDDPNLIRPGQALRVSLGEADPAAEGPAPKQAATREEERHDGETPVATHVVEAGDTFSRIALRYGVSIQSLVDANPGIRPERLRVGMTIRLATGPAPKSQPEPAAGTPEIKEEAGEEPPAKPRIVRNEGDFVQSLAIPSLRPEARREVKAEDESPDPQP